MTTALQTPIPVQPVERPILCSPYDEPTAHWSYKESGMPEVIPGRRPARYWVKSDYVGTGQLSLFAEEAVEELGLVNAVREDVRRWRQSNYEGATPITKQLLLHWARRDLPRPLFFCQREAVESVIYLNEIRRPGKHPRWRSAVAEETFDLLVDHPLNDGYPPLSRMGLKMATGSGKTVVMAMILAWAFCNRAKVPSDTRFPLAALLICPNLTIKERLQVLRPDTPNNYYEQFEIVPTPLRPLLHRGKLLITNWHQLDVEKANVEGGVAYAVVDKGQESPEAYARRILGDLYDGAMQGGLLVLNDEGHHAWRPKANPTQPINEETLDKNTDLYEATKWVGGIDRLNVAVGVRACLDLSATPFYIGGSGYREGAPFPWLVCDFGLVDAIESGIVKIPRLPASDTTGKPEAKYFRLWKNITAALPPGDMLSKGKPKPEAVYREAQPALRTLAGQWEERFKYIQAASPTQEKTPPVLIVVCDNTQIAELFFRKISGEQERELSDDKGKKRKVTTYGQGDISSDYFANTENRTYTIRIDSQLLAKAESGDSANRQEAAEQLRRVVATVGKEGEPGEHIRCVVSVSMLTEGWDANNVTHIFGLRAFESQLLCEQVVGRGLRRMDYTPDPTTGLLTEEYVDIYGVPFSLIPFKGRTIGKPEPQDKPKNHVHALPERAHYELRFPVVEGYAAALQRNLITAPIAEMEGLRIEPEREPTAVFVTPRVGDPTGPAHHAPGLSLYQDRQAYYDSTHLQTIEFEIARRITNELESTSTARMARHQLFPQVLRLVKQYVASKVDFRNVDHRELGQERYLILVVERLLAAIQPDTAAGERPMLPLLNRYEPYGSTATVNFKTTKPVFATTHSHLNALVSDTATWEQSAAFYLERAVARGVAVCYARNEGLNFGIPYEYYGIRHQYEPDFIVQLRRGARPQENVTVVLEIKGYETDQDRAKHQAAKRWVAAVNHWGQLGQWHFHVNRDPHALPGDLQRLAQTAGITLTLAPLTPEDTPLWEVPVPPSLAERPLPTAWLETVSLTDTTLTPLLEQLFRAGLPLPEVGYELRTDRLHRPMAELAWETSETALFILPMMEKDLAVFQEAGWAVFQPQTRVALLLHLQEKYL